MRDAFRPLWITLWKDIAKELFHLEKNGVIRRHGVQHFKQKPDRTLLIPDGIS
jgi:hypothetical protein